MRSLRFLAKKMPFVEDDVRYSAFLHVSIFQGLKKLSGGWGGGSDLENLPEEINSICFE